VALENLDLCEKMRVILLRILSPDAQFSCDTPCYSAFDLAFARAALELENLALRHQIGVLQGSAARWMIAVLCSFSSAISFFFA